jgi:hypothetical protein
LPRIGMVVSSKLQSVSVADELPFRSMEIRSRFAICIELQFCSGDLETRFAHDLRVLDQAARRAARRLF